MPAAVEIIGMPALLARLRAISSPVVGEKIMRNLAIATTFEAKTLVPKRTGVLSASILPRAVTPTMAEVVAHAKYAFWVEYGTGIYGKYGSGTRITPRNARVLAWAATAAGRTLSGRTLAKAAQGKPGLGAGGIKRVGGVGARSGPMIFRPSIAGMQPEPFLVPGAKQALLLGMPMIRNTVIMAWNL
jgi:hypothetical protein